jgi:hypothetical protein
MPGPGTQSVLQLHHHQFCHLPGTLLPQPVPEAPSVLQQHNHIFNLILEIFVFQVCWNIVVNKDFSRSLRVIDED